MTARKRRVRSAAPWQGAVSSPFPGWARVGLALATGGLLISLIAFFGVPLHRSVLLVGLVPDELVRQWCGGSWQRVGLADRLPLFVLATLIQLSMLGYGFVAMTLLGWRPARLGREGTDWPLAAALGLGVHGTVVMLAGWLGMLAWRHVAWLAMLFGVPFSVLAAQQGWQEWRRQRRSGRRRFQSHWGIGVGSAVLLAWGIYLSLAAVLPPHDFDVREYHLQVPKEWWQAGRLTFLSHNVYGNMPLGAEMAALESMVLWGGEDGWWWGALCGKLLMAWSSVWCAVWLLALGRRHRSVGAGLGAALLYAAIPGIIHVSINGLNEGCLALYYLGVFALLLEWTREHSPSKSAERVVRTVAALAGFAATIKYPAVLFVSAPLLAVAALMALLGRLSWRAVGTAALIAMSAGGAWYVKNAALSGNPVYPLAARWLDGRTRTPERIAQWERAHQVPRDSRGRRYSMGQAVDAAARLLYRSDRLPPLVVPLALVAAIQSWRSTETRLALVVLAVWFGLWFVATHRIERFYLPFLPVVAWLAAGPWRRRWPGYWQAVPTTAVVIALLYGGTASVSRFCGDNRILVSLDQLRDDEPNPSDPDMPRRTNPVHVWLNRRADLAEGEAVLLIGDAQPFDLEMPVYYNTCFDAPWLKRWLADRRTARQRRDALQRRRVRYVVVDWDEIARYRSTYGYSPYITRRLIEQELWQRQRVWKKVSLPVGRDVVVFEVARKGERGRR